VVNCAKKIFFFLLPSTFTTTTSICPSRRGVLCTLAFHLSRCIRRSSSLPRPTCQLLCILTPHRLGGAIGHPRRLVTLDPSFPPAEQHYARHAEGGCVNSRSIGRRLRARTVWKMYATLVLGVCVAVLLCYPLPGELSGLCVYAVHVSG
jgi:hypothetical protein